MRRFGFVTLAAVLLLGCSVPAHAQFTLGSTNPLTLRISPQNPRPYQTITVTPESNVIDLISASVVIRVNGRVVQEGSGAQSVPITVGGPGETTRITASATVGGRTYNAETSLRPADVALVVEPVSTVHPLYRGAALPAATSRVRLVALADLRTSPTNRLNPSSLVYTWRLGDQILQGESGIGRSVLSAIAPVRYRDARVTVTVTSADSSIVAQSTAVVSPVDPVVRIYHTDVLAGPDFANALGGTYVMAGQEDAFRGVAYFFGTAPSLSWSVGGQSASAEQDVTVRTTGSGGGTSSLSLTATNLTSGQTSEARLPIQFGPQRTNIFGF